MAKRSIMDGIQTKTFHFDQIWQYFSQNRSSFFTKLKPTLESCLVLAMY